MLPHRRHTQLLMHLKKVGMASVAELVQYLDSSPATVRRDIVELAQQGRVVKIRNGARLPDAGVVSEPEQNSANRRIAKAAVALCEAHSSAYVGTGDTALLMGEFFGEAQVKIYSNAGRFSAAMMAQKQNDFVMLGGQFVASQDIFISPPMPLNFRADWLFVEADGVTDSGVSKSAMLAYMEEQRMLSQSDRVVVLVPPEKFGVDSGILAFGWESVDVVISSNELNEHWRQVLTQARVEWVLV